jgi:hypothetical protein
MKREEVKDFLEKIALLQRMVDTFVKDDLIEGLIIPPGESPIEFSRQLAMDIIGDSKQFGSGMFILGIQPGKWGKRSIEEYKRSNSGTAACDNQLRGGMTMTLPNTKGDFCLTYRILPWRDILELSQSLFLGASPNFILGALREQGHGHIWRHIILH